MSNCYLESMIMLRDRFHSRYKSYSQLRGRGDAAMANKRAWMDINKEIKRIQESQDLPIVETMLKVMPFGGNNEN